MKKNNKKSTRKNTKVIDLTNEFKPHQTNIRKQLKPKTENQAEYIRAIAENTITFCQGLARSEEHTSEL